jgi:molybdate transport system substrate-binding protein
MHSRWAAVALVTVAVVASSCGGSRGGNAGARQVTVLAAASLRSAFAEIAEGFSAVNSELEVELSFGGSSELATQIEQGAPADVFASADLVNMARVVEAGDAADPDVFATNAAEIIVEAGNPEAIATVADLADPDLVVVQCAPEVPCGRYAAEVLENADVAVTPRSLETSVSGVVTKVTAGEADAGIVYRTDVLAAGDRASGVKVPDDINVVAEYPIATLRRGPNPTGAQAFVDFVLGSEGQAILARYGFGAP